MTTVLLTSAARSCAQPRTMTWGFRQVSLTTASGRFPTSSKRDFNFPKITWDEKNAKAFAQHLSAEERQTISVILKQMEEVSVKAEPETSAAVPKPDLSALHRLVVQQALPFIGFGFLDNLIMILAGEYIDHTIGVTLGISTMAAAALGNTVSDVFGIGSAWYVEHWALKLGVNPPLLTLEQLELPVCRIVANVGRALGIVIGCILGMAPLLFQ